jgi:hypothetical protein
MQRKYRSQGLRIIGVTYPPERLWEVRRFVQGLKVNYPIAMGTKATKDHFTASETLPMTVVIDREGNIRDVIEGIMYADEFAQKVKPLFVRQQPAPVKRSPRAGPKANNSQNVTILVSARGYKPASVRLRRGIPAQLTFIRTVEQSCGREIVVPDYGINKPLPLNTPVIVTLTPNKYGRIKFTCGMGMFRGELVVR